MTNSLISEQDRTVAPRLKRDTRLLDLLDAVEKNVAHTELQARRIKRTGMIFSIFGLMSGLAGGVLIADKVQSDTMNDALRSSMLRMQITNHELSRELARVSEELDLTRKRLDLYRDRETQSVAAVK